MPTGTQVGAQTGAEGPQRRGLAARLRSVRDWVLQPEHDDAEDAGSPYLRRRFLVAIGIVLVSTSSAVAAWRAETFNEYAGQNEAIYRQEVAGLEQRLRVDEEAVTSDMAQLPRVEQAAVLDHLLGSASKRATGAHGVALRIATVDQSALVNQAQRQDFEALSPFVAKGKTTFEPAPAIRNMVDNDVELGRLEPALYHERASADRDRSVKMTVVAAMFVLALVLLTVCDVRLARIASPRQSRPDRTTRSLPRAAVLVWVAAAAWFAQIVLTW
jgi:hypothetical protein